MCDCSATFTMPFTGQPPEKLVNALDFINDCGLQVEVFDAFLAEYKNTGDIDKAIHFARCEWDV